jgi:hypothetical protein
MVFRNGKCISIIDVTSDNWSVCGTGTAFRDGKCVSTVDVTSDIKTCLRVPPSVRSPYDRSYVYGANLDDCKIKCDSLSECKGFTHNLKNKACYMKATGTRDRKLMTKNRTHAFYEKSLALEEM